MDSRIFQSIGQRIASVAESFIGVPYDTDPLGAYVTHKVIIYDCAMDCMYHTFRSVELALACSKIDPIEIALSLRFLTHGIIDNQGMVQNYDQRFQYAEDMIYSGKWGINITKELSVKTINIKGDRGKESIDIIPRENIPDSISHLISGDIIYFVKAVDKRIVGEIIGHLGIIKKEDDSYQVAFRSRTRRQGGNDADVLLCTLRSRRRSQRSYTIERNLVSAFLIHASGKKNIGGEVKKVSFIEYCEQMAFIGIMVTRFIDN